MLRGAHLTVLLLFAAGCDAAKPPADQIVIAAEARRPVAKIAPVARNDATPSQPSTAQKAKQLEDEAESQRIITAMFANYPRPLPELPGAWTVIATASHRGEWRLHEGFTCNGIDPAEPEALDSGGANEPVTSAPPRPKWDPLPKNLAEMEWEFTTELKRKDPVLHLSFRPMATQMHPFSRLYCVPTGEPNRFVLRHRHDRQGNAENDMHFLFRRTDDTLELAGGENPPTDFEPSNNYFLARLQRVGVDAEIGPFDGMWKVGSIVGEHAARFRGPLDIGRWRMFEKGIARDFRLVHWGSISAVQAWTFRPKPGGPHNAFELVRCGKRPDPDFDFHGIYSLHGDELKLAQVPLDEPLPSSVESAVTEGKSVMTLRRTDQGEMNRATMEANRGRPTCRHGQPAHAFAFARIDDTGGVLLPIR